ncbi:Spc7-domain-containing protein [Acrodontium crateriforme]|uniref:Spc7-domain-containing protein n=1 Tax=Acrodontium crateriforme TaxID=150365 RepID=A0AAQ3M2Z5_9PEZI|nr:Spc7-domain-containing protein [Acrodontium crateriforme]
MADLEDKENFAPLTSSDPLQRRAGSTSPQKKPSRKGRSKSIGPGGLDENVEEKKQDAKIDAKNRRKSTYVPATKAIISADAQKAARQAERRRTLANRRVSFAPEATLHTWDVIEFMRDPTTSTESPDSTRRTSSITELNNDGNEDSALLETPSPDKKKRRSSGIPPMNFNNPDDFSSSEMSGSEVSESEGEEDESSADETGTAMSLDIDNNTAHSMAESDASTGSSARLEAALRQAAEMAGTRGIEYDEHGDGDMSMEIAGEEITNAFQPWAQRADYAQNGSAAMDQENVNPFSPMFKAQMISGTVTGPSTIAEEDTGDMSMDVTRAMGAITKAQSQLPQSSPLGDGTMDVTRAVGGIMRNQSQLPESSPFGDRTMDMTQAVGVIHNGASQKRRRSTTEDGSPGSTIQPQSAKRRRSSVARSSMGDDAMDLTMAMGSIHQSASPERTDRRRSVARRQSLGLGLEQDDATMEFTKAIGSIKPADRTNHTSSSFDENEELTMELTTNLGAIQVTSQANSGSIPTTPRTSQSPVRFAANTTPNDQERYKDTPDYGSKKLLTPIFQKQSSLSADKKIASAESRRKSMSPSKLARPSPGAEVDENGKQTQAVVESNTPQTPKESQLKTTISYPKLPTVQEFVSPIRATPNRSPIRTPTQHTPKFSTPVNVNDMLDAQLNDMQPSPSIQKQQRSSPAKVSETPQKIITGDETRTLAQSIRMMNTPRKEVLKSFTPKKQATGVMSPPKMMTPKMRPMAKSQTTMNQSPMRHLSDELLSAQSSDRPVEKIKLQAFLEEAGIRFMELTATKRRLTTAPTPSKARRESDYQDEDEPKVDLESAVVAAACTTPELEMFRHACHELKRYISDGKKVIKQLEHDTYENTPPFIQAYQNAGPPRRAALDAQMRDMKTHARLRSKEMWYAWRSQLLEDLVKALSGIAENLIRDHDILKNSEDILDNVLPDLINQHDTFEREATRLQEASSANSEEKAELEAARARIVEVDAEIEAKKQILEALQREAKEQDSLTKELQETKVEFTAAIQEADRVRESCRGVSLNEISKLKEAITNLEETYGWKITTASSSPPTVTMSYKHQLELFFHPEAFKAASSSHAGTWPNAPVSLTFVEQNSRSSKPKQELTTTLRFFLQLLRASLQGMPQCNTRIPDLLRFVSDGWDTAVAISEAERRLGIEAPTSSRIVGDERLAIETTVFLPKVRTKVRVSFGLAASIAAAGGEMDDAGPTELSTSLNISAKVVYGQQYNEAKMTKVLLDHVGQSFDGWDAAVMDLKAQLVAQGAKGSRK